MGKKWEMNMEHLENAQNNSEMIIYTTADGLTKIETTMTRQRLKKYKARTLSGVERDYLDAIQLLEQKTGQKGIISRG